MNKEILQKVAEFNNLALEKISSLQLQVESLKKEALDKEAQEKDRLDDAVKTAADALYDSDFITDRFAYRDFVKKASQSPEYLAKTITKVCSFKDVLGYGTPSNVTINVKEAFEKDPIYSRCFGDSSSGFANLLED